MYVKINYLARIRVDDADVGHVLCAPHHELLHVAPDGCEARALDVVLAYQLEKLDDVAQKLLRDALARRVDADFDAGRAVEHGRAEHADADRFPEAAWRADQNFLLDVAPVVSSQDFALLA